MDRKTTIIVPEVDGLVSAIFKSKIILKTISNYIFTGGTFFNLAA
ncbi:MAG: hypothetical protein ACI8QD_002738 [Cyclobacteriaceae bacterium]|jgi:hypothetical protein